MADRSCLLAVSGGADSMALLVGIARLQERLDIRDLHVAHLNHQLRGDQSDADEHFVRQQAEALGPPVTTERLDVATEAQRNGESLETAARHCRYAFLARTARRTGCRIVATAHTADDQAETILHRILRGTGLRGLAGIPAVRQLPPPDDSILIVRPLLDISRSEIESFLCSENVPWRQDNSNTDTTFTRNRIRHELLPLLRQQYNPQVNTALLRLGQVAAQIEALLNEDAAALLPSVLKEQSDARVVLDIPALSQLQQLRQIQVLSHVIHLLGIPQGSLGFEHVLALLGTVSGEQSAHDLPQEWTVRRANQELIIERSRSADRDVANLLLKPVSLSVPGLTELPKGYCLADRSGICCRAVQQFLIEKKEIDVQSALERSRTIDTSCEVVDADCLAGGLTLRQWQEGERFIPLGAGGHKKVGDFLTDNKVPTAYRKHLAVVADEKGIVWICGLRIAERVKVTDKTRQALALGVLT